ncbi:MAG: class I SAM-dependent methyltransferase [Pseudomonadota bacterium]
MSGQRQLSRTALGTAHLRALHRLRDARPLILDDPVAAALLGPELMQRLDAAEARRSAQEAAILRAHVVLRSRYAEDRLALAVARGVDQYVILGAGLDTFALRQPAWAGGLTIFEVDQPASQAFKRQRIARAGLHPPANLRWVAIDFERESLRDGLARGGVALDRPAFFAWLGVTMYLNQAAIAAVLGAVASFPAGSEMVLTFQQPPQAAPAADVDAASPLSERVAGLGEPFVSFFTTAAMANLLQASGFRELEFLTPAQSRRRYFDQRPADLPAPPRTAIVAAQV